MNDELSARIIGFPTCAAGLRARFRVAMCSKNEVLAVLTTRNAKRRSRDQGFRLVAFAPTASNRFRNVERLPKPRFCCTSMRSNVRGGREERRAKRGRHEGGEARTALAVGRMRGSQRASNADGREGRKVRAARRSRDEGSRTGTGTARCGRARRSQDAGDAGAQGVRDAVARPGGCRAREVMARRSPTPRAGARPPRRASSSPEATCPSSRAP